MNSNRRLWLLALGCALFAAVGCGGGGKGAAPENPEPSSPAASAPSASAPAVANAGSIRGTITFTGQDLDAAITMNADPACARLHPKAAVDDAVATQDGKLANVFVYVKSGLEGKSFPVPAEAKIVDQQGCIYQPRVVGLQVGQTLEVRNGDVTPHNVHAMAAANTEFNEPQPRLGMVLEKKFEQPEVMVSLKCDLHPWMKAYVGVVPNPYYAVTGDNGVFAIGNLPPGTYTIEAWHEKLGTQEKQVTVAPNGTATVTFDFKG
ncbi:MAG TPA: carboxypeptidase regulatory-like domain-containing protein [Thermoanaerobaculia bacterium]|nr:carboxypeptidase regulatory-like domain-containing protein [Thermoanaerobaculia bacterium]